MMSWHLSNILYVHRHSDWNPWQAVEPSGPRLFTLFIYLSTTATGATWFPMAESASGETLSARDLEAFYDQYRTAGGRQTMDQAAGRFADAGLRVLPKVGTAILWPNTQLDNVFKEHPLTAHAAEPLAEGPGGEKWAMNAWIHMRDFRTPHGKGLLK